MPLDDQLVVRMSSKMRAAIKRAARSVSISEGAAVRFVIEANIDYGLLEPDFFIHHYRERDQKQERAE